MNHMILLRSKDIRKAINVDNNTLTTYIADDVYNGLWPIYQDNPSYKGCGQYSCNKQVLRPSYFSNFFLVIFRILLNAS